MIVQVPGDIPVILLPLEVQTVGVLLANVILLSPEEDVARTTPELPTIIVGAVPKTIVCGFVTEIFCDT